MRALAPHNPIIVVCSHETLDYAEVGYNEVGLCLIEEEYKMQLYKNPTTAIK